MIKAFIYSLLISLFSIACFDWGVYKNGYSFGYYNFANMCYLGTTFIVNFFLFIYAKTISVLLISINLISMLLFIILWSMEDSKSESLVYKTYDEI